MKQPLILLHGALGEAGQFAPLKGLLEGDFDLHLINFTGHGPSPSTPGAFRMEDFVQDVLDHMEQHGLKDAHIFGYSMGGYVALCLAKQHPQKVKSIATLATKMHWNEAIAARETALLDPGKMEAKVPQLAAALAARHTGKDWKALVLKTAALLQQLGSSPLLKEEDIQNLQLPVMIMLGDRDKMVSLDETMAVYKQLPNGRMAMLPATSHPYEQVDNALLAPLLLHYFSSPKV